LKADRAMQTERELTVCLVYPNRREVGLGNLGFQKIFRSINSGDSVVCDTAFLEDGDGESSGGKRLGEFDIVAFSVTFEMDIMNVLSILERASIPLPAEERSDSDPVVCAGGVAVTLNPEPVSPFMDFCFIGEGEQLVGDIMNRLFLNRADRRSERLAELSAVAGVYVPSLYEVRYGNDGEVVERIAKDGAPETVTRQYRRDYGRFGMEQCVMEEESVFRDTYLIETGKGCGQGCRFCAAGFIYRPIRHVDGDVVREQVSRGLELKKRIGLVGSAICEHPDINGIYDYILERGGEIAVSSLRIGYADGDTFRRLAEGGCRSVTLAPEAGSERLRRVINKDITDEEIMDTVRSAASAGIMNVKLYFLIGLPTETDEDVAAIAGLLKKTRDAFVEASKPFGRAGRINAGINPFVPKPHTPFQWEPFADLTSLRKKARSLRRMLGGEPNLELSVESARNAAVQALLSVGTREVGRMLLEAHEGKAWTAILRTEQARRIYGRKKDVKETLPWDFVDSVVRKDYLVKEYEKSFSGRTTSPCPSPRRRCKSCGLFPGNCI